ncbi:MAG: MarR family transcriptional regulator [Hyphomicrobiaceae bacterium]|nr:MarR family transcriptional regulator [Hyphomicrobiaceae bacterium]
MTDINEPVRTARTATGAAPKETAGIADEAQTADPALLDLAELLFFAYRDFTREPDKILDEFGFGRAHHRVLHFVNRRPGMRVADLLKILKITKQSLGRVLKQLIDEGFIVQEEGKLDRRERLLYPTDRGHELAARLAEPQLERVARALRASRRRGDAKIETFLYQMISEADRPHVERLLRTKLNMDHKQGEPQ